MAAGVDLFLTTLRDDIVDLMERRGIHRSELARRLGTSPAYVTKLLRGGTNLTVASLVKLAHALDAELAVELAPAKKRRDEPAFRNRAPKAETSPEPESEPPKGRESSWRVW